MSTKIVPIYLSTYKLISRGDDAELEAALNAAMKEGVRSSSGTSIG